jgi:hypothetical protein
VFQEFDVLNSTINRMWKNRTRIFSAFEHNESRIKGFRKPEQSEVNEALLKLLFEQEISGNVPMCGPLSSWFLILS